MENNELLHYGVKGQKWGVINEKDDQEHRLSYEKERMKYGFKNRESEMFYQNQNKKDKMDYKRDLKLAKIQERIEKGKQYTDRALSNDVRLGQKYKYNAIAIASISAALATSSIGDSISSAIQSRGPAQTKIINDYRHDYTESKVSNSTRNINDNSSRGLISISKQGSESKAAPTAPKVKIPSEPKIKVAKEPKISIPKEPKIKAPKESAKAKIVSAVRTPHNNGASPEYWYNMLQLENKKLGHSDILGEIVGASCIPVSYLDEVMHSGTKGMKWGIRRYQNKDGSLTELGRLRYYGNTEKQNKLINSEFEKIKEALEKQPEFADFPEGYKQTLYQQAELRARENAEKIMNERADKLQLQKDSGQWEIDKVKTGAEVLERTSDLFKDVKDLVPNVSGTSTHPDYSDISTEELIKRTNRLNAESSYARASGEMIYTPSKQEITRERLQTMGAVIGILAAAGNVILPFTKLKFGSSGGKSKGGGD